MAISPRDWAIIAAGGAFVLLGGYIAISETSKQQPPVVPEAEINATASAVSFNLDAGMLGVSVRGGLSDEAKLLHFWDPTNGFHSNPPNQQVTTCKHRYPTISGTNISTLIHRGYSPMMVPSAKDYDWLSNPPSEEMF